MNRSLPLIVLLLYAAFCRTCPAQFQAVQRDVMAMYLYNGSDETTFKRQLEQRTDAQVTRMVQVVKLDAAQREKLQLAARGDLSRFYRELDQVREKVKDLQPNNGPDRQRAFRDIGPLRQRIANGIIDKNSLLERVLTTMLRPEQMKVYRADLRERQLYRYQTILRMTIADLEKVVPLTAKQRSELIKLLEQKNFPVASPQGMEAYVGHAMLARLSDEETTQLLDKEQLAAFRRFTEQFAPMMNSFTW